MKEKILETSGGSMSNKPSCKILDFKKIAKEINQEELLNQREEMAELIRKVLEPSELFKLEVGKVKKKKGAKSQILKFPTSDDTPTCIKG